MLSEQLIIWFLITETRLAGPKVSHITIYLPKCIFPKCIFQYVIVPKWKRSQSVKFISFGNQICLNIFWLLSKHLFENLKKKIENFENFKFFENFKNFEIFIKFWKFWKYELKSTFYLILKILKIQAKINILYNFENFKNKSC